MQQSGDYKSNRDGSIQINMPMTSNGLVLIHMVTVFTELSSCSQPF